MIKSAVLLGQLYWHPDGFGYIEVNDQFKMEEWIIQADALSDWSKGLRNEYEARYKIMLREWERKKQIDASNLDIVVELNKRQTKKKK